MTSIENRRGTLGCAAVMLLMMTVPSGAQSYPNDTWSHTVIPGANGQCWISTDQAFSDRGFGYWGACASHTTSVNEASGAHAQAHPRHLTHHH